jgi:hypothetical protein
VFKLQTIISKREAVVKGEMQNPAGSDLTGVIFKEQVGI